VPRRCPAAREGRERQWRSAADDRLRGHRRRGVRHDRAHHRELGDVRGAAGNLRPALHPGGAALLLSLKS
jgi:hypothetical protein